MRNEFVYQYRIAGDASIHRIRAPESLDTEAIRRTLRGTHGAEPMFVSLVRTATAADAGIPGLSEGGTSDADPYNWAAAIAKVNSGRRDNAAKPSAEIAASWDEAFKKVREGN